MRELWLKSKSLFKNEKIKSDIQLVREFENSKKVFVNPNGIEHISEMF